MGTVIKKPPIITTPTKIQSSLATKSNWVRMIEDLEKSVFASDVLANEDGSKFNNGNISAAEKISHFAKGIGLTFTSMAKNWQHSLIGAIGFGTLLTFCPTLSVPLAVLGTFAGAFQIGSSIIKASTATNNKDARLAYQGMGTGLLTFLPSFFGCKSALKTANRYRVIGDKTADEASVWESFIECVKLSFGKQQKGSLNVYQVAGKTAASKFKSLFVFKAKKGNGKAEKMLEDIEEKLKQKIEDAKKIGDGETGDKHKILGKKEAENNLFNAEQNEAQAKYDYEKYDVEGKRSQKMQLQEELDDLPQSKTDLLKRNEEILKEYQAKIDKLEDDYSFNKAVRRNTHPLKRDPFDGAMYERDQRNKGKIKEQLRADMEKLQRSWETVEEDRRHLKAQIKDIDEEIRSASQTKNERLKDWNMAKDKLEKAQEALKATTEYIEKAENKLANFKQHVTENEKRSEILKAIGGLDEDTLVNGITDSEWEKTAAKHITDKQKPQLIFAIDDSADLRNSFRSDIYSKGGDISAPVHDAYCYYVDWSNPDQFLAKVKDMKPETNFFSKDTPLWDGITKTIQTFATGNWLNKQNE